MRLLTVAAEQSVLCLALWPRTDARGQDSAGNACTKQASQLGSLV